jgi:hypothetical protein
LVMVGQGMPSVTLGSGAAELGFHSLKLGGAGVSA